MNYLLNNRTLLKLNIRLKHSVSNLNDLSSDRTPILLPMIVSIEWNPPHSSLSQDSTIGTNFPKLYKTQPTLIYFNIALLNSRFKISF